MVALKVQIEFIIVLLRYVLAYIFDHRKTFCMLHHANEGLAVIEHLSKNVLSF